MSFRTITLSAASALVLWTGAACIARAETMKVSATLTGKTEVPPNDSKGTGTLTGSYDSATKKLDFEVTYSGLTGPAVAAHFHAPAPAGKNAGIEIPVKGSLASPIKGDLTLTDADAKNLTDGMTYFNLHTKAHMAGELRGQIAVDK